jgi:septal ring factor EnvC (AmiA/AmiB activator)
MGERHDLTGATSEQTLNDPKSTNDITMIAREAIRQQAEVCEERRGRTDDRLARLSRMAEDNAKAVDKLSESIASLSATVTQLAATVAYQSTTLASHGGKISDHDTQLAVLAVRMGIAAVIGGSIPPIAQWVIQAIQNR